MLPVSQVEGDEDQAADHKKEAPHRRAEVAEDVEVDQEEEETTKQQQPAQNEICALINHDQTPSLRVLSLPIGRRQVTKQQATGSSDKFQT